MSETFVNCPIPMLALIQSMSDDELAVVQNMARDEYKARLAIRIRNGEFPKPSDNDLHIAKHKSRVHAILNYYNRNRRVGIQLPMHIAKEVIDWYMDTTRTCLDKWHAYSREYEPDLDSNIVQHSDMCNSCRNPLVSELSIDNTLCERVHC